MSPLRRSLLVLSLFAAMAQPTFAQPVADGRPIHLVVPYAAGGTTDIVARLIASRISDDLGQPVIVENKPGGGGTIALAQVAKSPADGTALLLGGLEITTAPSLVASQEALATRDLTGVAGLSLGALVLTINPEKTPYADLAALLEDAKAKPGVLTFASAGIGNVTHLFGEIFTRRADVDILHIPYRGAAPALTDLQAGQVTLMMAGTGSIRPFIESGRLRALAVTGTDAAQAGVPGTPTFAEAGLPLPETDSGAWTALFAPKGTPEAVVKRLERAVQNALAQPEVQQQLAAAGLAPFSRTAEEVNQHLAEQSKVWNSLIREAGIAPN